MLASPACLSAWPPESFLLKDYQLPVPDDHSDFDLGTLSPVVQADNQTGNSFGSAGTSCGTSAASSDCSVDDLYLEGDDDDFLVAGISDLPETSDILDVLSGVNWTGNDDLMSILSSTDLDMISYSSPPHSPTPSLHSQTSSSSSMSHSPTPSLSQSPSQSPAASHTCSSIPEVSRKTHSKKSLQHRKWSSLTPSERLSVVEDLSTTVSCEMGLREQLEVIKIINPSANVSTTDTEFAIDLDSLDDDKLSRIQELVKLHSQTTAETLEEGKVNHSPLRKHAKRSKHCEKRSSPKQPAPRQRKEYKQLLKERRSGLFVKEQILALSATAVVEEEDVDIDILG